VDGRELPNCIDGADRPIIESNEFLEWALCAVAKCNTDFELMEPVVTFELPLEPGIWRNCQISSTVPVRDLTLCRRSGRPSRSEHRYRLQDCRFSAGVGTNRAKTSWVDRQTEPAERAEFIQLQDTQAHQHCCPKCVSERR